MDLQGLLWCNSEKKQKGRSEKRSVNNEKKRGGGEAGAGAAVC